tara:strand:- start:258 stop:737 length:480 start_codon:yes stop_codon:yes gene_type:complete
MFQKIANFEKKIKAKKALKNKRKEAHKLNELNFLTRKNEINSSSFNDEVGIVDEVTTEPTATEKITSATKTKRMTQKQVQKIHENRIGMVQIPNGNWQATTGDVDGQFTAFAELSEWLVVSPNPKNRKENRIFLNTDDKKLKAKFVTQCKKEGFEVSFN